MKSRLGGQCVQSKLTCGSTNQEWTAQQSGISHALYRFLHLDTKMSWLNLLHQLHISAVAFTKTRATSQESFRYSSPHKNLWLEFLLQWAGSQTGYWYAYSNSGQACTAWGLMRGLGLCRNTNWCRAHGLACNMRSTRSSMSIHEDRNGGIFVLQDSAWVIKMYFKNLWFLAPTLNQTLYLLNSASLNKTIVIWTMYHCYFTTCFAILHGISVSTPVSSATFRNICKINKIETCFIIFRFSIYKTLHIKCTINFCR